ncbi:hypothetical protein [Aurantiacibacter gilvus]|uniref:Uncharacterized protein n=1 Tax=Aurantiacibacter gilvus TaxID=3139141 RepID=A0ABU9IAF0_9SPHN
MKKQLFVAALPLLALAACGESAETDETAAADPLAELAAGTGPYLVTYADGSQTLSYAAHDGTEWGGPIDLVAGAEPVRWSAPEDQVCIDFPDSMEDATDFCIEYGPLQEDGSWTARNPNNPDEDPATMRRLDAPVETEADMIAAGTYWIDMPDGETALAVWADDGVSYLAMNPTRSTWRADGNQRCTTPADGEESCGVPTSELGEDNSFTAEDNGEQITVRML